METSTSQIYWTIGTITVSSLCIIVLILMMPSIVNSVTNFMLNVTNTSSDGITASDKAAFKQAQREANS